VIFVLAAGPFTPPGMAAEIFLLLFCMNTGCSTLSSVSSSEELSDKLLWLSTTAKHDVSAALLLSLYCPTRTLESYWD
jgi:hypothetical protein